MLVVCQYMTSFLPRRPGPLRADRYGKETLDLFEYLVPIFLEGNHSVDETLPAIGLMPTDERRYWFIVRISR